MCASNGSSFDGTSIVACDAVPENVAGKEAAEDRYPPFSLSPRGEGRVRGMIAINGRVELSPPPSLPLKGEVIIRKELIVGADAAGTRDTHPNSRRRGTEL